MLHLDCLRSPLISEFENWVSPEFNQCGLDFGVTMQKVEI